MKTYNLCFIGFGNVGRALARLLQEKTPELRDRYGIQWHITGVATRRMGWVANPNGLDVSALLAGGTATESDSLSLSNIREWLEAVQADVLFEVSSLNPQTGQPAIDHLRAALEYGAHAVTANKGPVVHAYRELHELAMSKGRRFLFESTAMGGAPIFSLFRECLPAARLLRFRGIFNSTTSIIIEEMEAGRSFDEAVKKAQSMGIAETDPGNDVDGWDATVKVCAIATVLMGVSLKPEDVQREGIRGLSAEMVQEARRAGKPFKLVSQAEYRDGSVVASVRPEQLVSNDPLASARGAELMAHFEMDVLPGLSVKLDEMDDTGPRSTAYGLLVDFVRAVAGLSLL